jgi:hypothetical protein
MRRQLRRGGAEKVLKMTMVIAGAGWFAFFIAAHFAGERAKKAIGGFAVVGPLVAVVLVAALLEAWRRIGDDDKAVFGAAITAYATGVVAALELLVRGTVVAGGGAR